MTASSGDWRKEFENLTRGLGEAFGPLGASTPKPAPKPAPKPLPKIRGKHIDGVLYVRADDVADAIDTQLPGKATRLVRKLRGK